MPETLWDEGPQSFSQQQEESQLEHKNRQDVARIVWPTSDYVARTAVDTCNSMLFMRPDILTAMAPDVQNQLHQYRCTLAEPSVPHQKCYLRLLSTPTNSESECTCAALSWCLMSSACLSRGAQGDIQWPAICSVCGHERQVLRRYQIFIMTESGIR